MKTKVYLRIALSIIVIISIGMFGTFIPENFIGFFGDVAHVCTSKYHHTCYAFFDDGLEWGARHYWYYWGAFMMFILSLVSAIIGIANVINEEYKN